MLTVKMVKQNMQRILSHNTTRSSRTRGVFRRNQNDNVLKFT